MTTGGDLAGDTVAVILAGGQGTRLGALTRDICKPALPFGAAYRNIDFSLSNCLNSGIPAVGVATQHNASALLDHIDHVWQQRAQRNGAAVFSWPAQSRAPGVGYRGTADAVFRNLDLIGQQKKRLVLVLAGDHIYRMDYRPMLEFHRSNGADVTVGSFGVPARDASQFGVMSVDRRGQVQRFVEKPKCPRGLSASRQVIASMGIYVFETEFLSRILRLDAFSSVSQHDFGGDILPAVLGQSRVFAYRHAGIDRGRPAYWRDVGTPRAYWQANLELLDDAPALCLQDPDWPLPAAWGAGASMRCPRDRVGEAMERSLVASGCEIDGDVRRSVLFPGVTVSGGSTVASSVVLPGATIGRDCHLYGTIVDRDCHVPDGTVIRASEAASLPGAEDVPVIVTAERFAPERIHAYA